MGTPEFAVPTLKAIHSAGFEVVAVITVPDKPVGRGQKTSKSPVKEAAEKLGLRVLQPIKLKEPDFQQTIKELAPDLGVVVAFRMLPESIWSLPKLGTINLHASLLPKYRGAAPINWAIVNGETETGNSTFFLRHEIDTGPLIFQEKEAILPDDTAGSLYVRLMNKGAQLIVKTIQAIETEKAPSIEQDLSLKNLPIAPKLQKEDGLLNFELSAEELHNRVRGLAPWPGTYLLRNGETIKILKTSVISENIPTLAKEEWLNTGKRLMVGCGNSSVLEILELQAAGKKPMAASAFLLGNTW